MKWEGRRQGEIFLGGGGGGGRRSAQQKGRRGKIAPRRGRKRRGELEVRNEIGCRGSGRGRQETSMDRHRARNVCVCVCVCFGGGGGGVRDQAEADRYASVRGGFATRTGPGCSPQAQG